MKLSPLIIAQQNFFSVALSVSEKLQPGSSMRHLFVLRKTSNAAAPFCPEKASPFQTIWPRGFYIKISRPLLSDPYSSRTRISYFKPILRLQVHLGLLLEFTPGLNLYFFGQNLCFMASSLLLSWLYNQPGPPSTELVTCSTSQSWIASWSAAFLLVWKFKM